MFRHLPHSKYTCPRGPRLILAAVLALSHLALSGGHAAEPGPARSQAARPHPPASRGVPGAQPARPRLQKAYFKQPTEEERLQFHNEMERNGWQGAVPAVIPTSYTHANGSVSAATFQFATLYGDVDGDNRPEWVTGYYFSPKSASGAVPKSAARGAELGGSPATTLRDDRARIVVFGREGNGPWRVQWRSPGLGFEFHVPEFNLSEVQSKLDRLENLRPPLSLVNIDGDRSLEIVYNCWSASDLMGALPGVYRYDGARWVSVAPQADRFGLQDVDDDGKLELITGSPYIGYGMGDDDVPRVWRWNGRQYQEASSEYPEFYKDLASRYTAYVKDMEARGEVFKRPAWERAIQKAISLAG
jgi:hypothetical protein